MNDMTPVDPNAQLVAQVEAMKKDLQSAQDMINALSEQRNASNNQVVNLSVQVQASNRQLAEKDQKIAALEAQVEKLGMSKDADGETDLTE